MFSEIAPFHITYAGPFGRATAGFLRRDNDLIEDRTFSSEFGASDDGPDAAAMILVAERPMPRLSESIAAYCWRRALPFVPLFLQSGLMQLGPITIAGEGACWDCWSKRFRQHDAAPLESAALLQFYDEHPERGPRGFLQPFAALAADRIRPILELCETEPEAAAGSIWQIDMFSRRVTTGRVIGVDGCVNCGLNRPLETRSYADARQALGFLWQGVPGAQ